MNFRVLTTAVFFAAVQALATEAAGQVETVNKNVLLFVGPQTTEKQADLALEATNSSLRVIWKRLGTAHRKKTQIFVSSDIDWLVDQVARVERMPSKQTSGFRKRWKNDWWAEAGQGWVAVNALRLEDRRGAVKLLAHEIFHTIQYEAAGRRARGYFVDDFGTTKMGPNWLLEGAAEYIAFFTMQELGLDSIRRGFRVSERNAFRPSAKHPKSMEDKPGMRKAGPYDKWDVSKSAAKLLIETSGIENLIPFWSNLEKGQPWKKAFRNAFGIGIDEFYQQYSARKG